MMEASTDTPDFPVSSVLSDEERSSLPSGRDLVHEGLKLGAAVELGTTAWSAKSGYRSENEYKRDMAARGEITWSLLMGLATLDEQIEGLRYIYDACERTGVRIDRALVIPSPLSGLPRESREGLPRTTSFILEGREEHIRIAQAAPMQPVFGDFHIGSPAALENTLDAVAAGCSTHGIFSQFLWTLPGWRDEIGALAANIKAVAVIAAKHFDRVAVDTYLDDGAPSHFMDHVSTVGYTLIEHHVVSNLCGARFSASLGGLMSHLPTKIAVWLALDQLLRTDIPGVSYLYGSTIDSSADVPVSNYGGASVETLALAATEKRFRTGASIQPVPIHEKTRVPSAEEIFELLAVCQKAAVAADDVASLLDYAGILRIKDTLVERGREFAQNALRVISSLGYDTTDPLQVLLALRRIGPVDLELAAHPRQRDDAHDGTINAWVPTELMQRSQRVRDDEIAAVRAAGLGASLCGRRIVVGSSDTHTFGLHVLSEVLEAVGAEVVNGGRDLDEVNFVQLARDSRPAAIAISTHNGQCLQFSRNLKKLMKDSGISCPVFLGGQLNGYVSSDDKLPRDVTPQLRELGVVPCESTIDMVMRCRELLA